MTPNLFTSPALLLRVVIDANVLAYLTLAKLLLALARREGLFCPSGVSKS